MTRKIRSTEFSIDLAVEWCIGTAAHFPHRRLGVQTQSEAGCSGHQAVIGRGSHFSFESNTSA